MARFTPCQGKSACRDNGEYCLTCNRSSLEIATLREALVRLSDLAVDHDYCNIEDYATYVGNKLTKMIRYRQQQDRSHGQAC